MKTLIVLIAALTALAVAQAAPEDARALFEAGMAKMTQAGTLARDGKFVAANDLLRTGGGELDRAIAMAPDDVEMRARRGLLFHRIPYLPGRAEQSAKDLRWVKDHPRFHELPENLRTDVEKVLGGARPDRFPQVSATTSPVIAVLSYTAPGAAAEKVPTWVGSVTQAIHGYPGLLGTHAVASVDHPGMYVLFTWWTDKTALNNFYYSDLHQRWMRTRGDTMMAMPGSTPNAAELPTQTAAEILSGYPVPGGRINGGFVPQEVVERFSRSPDASTSAK